MVRFIFVCMGVVALSILSIGGQFLFQGLESARETVVARNVPEAAPVVAAQDSTPESLNAIETAAGVSDAGNEWFGPAFTDSAPKALEDEDSAPLPIPFEAIAY
jgi:hypothetical protein